MANTETWIVEEYITDIGTTANNLKFKVERGKMSETGLTYTAPTTATSRRPACPSLRYFTPRKLVAKFNDGFSIELVVPTIEEVGSYAGILLASGDIACVSLKGEQWKFLPPGVLGGNYTNSPIANATDKPDSTKFTYSYALDGALASTAIILSTSMENTPADIFVQQQACITKVPSADTIKCAGSKGIQPRRFIGERMNSTTGGTIRRQIIVSSNDPAEIKECGEGRMGSFNCLAYQGQTIANVADYYTATTTP